MLNPNAGIIQQCNYSIWRICMNWKDKNRIDHGEPNFPSLTSKTCSKSKRARKDWIFCHETHLPNFQCLKFHKDHNQKVSMTFPLHETYKRVAPDWPNSWLLKSHNIKNKTKQPCILSLSLPGNSQATVPSKFSCKISQPCVMKAPDSWQVPVPYLNKSK